jgi:hypothetical protein
MVFLIGLFSRKFDHTSLSVAKMRLRRTKVFIVSDPGSGDLGLTRSGSGLSGEGKDRGYAASSSTAFFPWVDKKDLYTKTNTSCT